MRILWQLHYEKTFLDSPELNPIEQVWKFLRSNYLSNRVYETIDDVFTACCEAWNLFAAQPEVISSIGMRAFIDLK